MKFLLLILTLFFVADQTHAGLANVEPEEFESWKKGAKASAQAAPFNACGALLFKLNGSEDVYFFSSATLIQPDVIIGANHALSYIDNGTYFFTLDPNVEAISHRASLGDLFEIKFARKFKDQDIAVCLLDRPIATVAPASVLTSREHASRQSLAFAAFDGVYAGYGRDFPFIATQQISTEAFKQRFQGEVRVVGLGGSSPRIVELTPQQQDLSEENLAEEFPKMNFEAKSQERTLGKLQIMNFALNPSAFSSFPDAALEFSPQSRLCVSLVNKIDGMGSMQKGFSAAVPGDSGAGMFVNISTEHSKSMFEEISVGDRFSDVAKGNWKLAHIVVQGRLDDRISRFDAENNRWVHMVHTYAEDIHFSAGRLDRAIESLRKASAEEKK